MTDPITPQEAQQLRDGATEGPWMLNPYGNILQGDDPDDPVTAVIGRADPYIDAHAANGELMAAAPRLAATLAADTVEYGVEYTKPDGESGLLDLGRGSTWESDREYARQMLYPVRRFFPEIDIRLIARRVSEPWEVTE